MRRLGKRLSVERVLGLTLCLWLQAWHFQFASAGENVLLKNGMTIRANKKMRLRSLGGTPAAFSDLRSVKDADPEPYGLAMIENDWQVFYLSDSLLKPTDSSNPSVPIKFTLGKLKSHKFAKQMRAVGSVVPLTDIDEHGRRIVKIALSNKQENVKQSIVEIEPDHYLIDSDEVAWSFGLSLKTLPFETLEKIIRKKVDHSDAMKRLSLSLFYVQAEYYEPAFKELDAIARDFPDQQATVDKQRALYMDYFGRDILQRLRYRQRAGQHSLGEFMATQLVKQELSTTVKGEVQKYLQNYSDDRHKIERVKLLLSEWQSKLTDPEQEKKLDSLRSEVNEQLNFETLPRFDAFLKAEEDRQYEPDQRLGIAYSAWLLGPANAIPDLEQALRVWEARNLVVEYLHSDDPAKQNELISRLQSMENISADKVILRLIDQLPPLLDASEIEPATPHLVDTGGSEPVKYWVALPMEYSPQHRYPMIVALRSRNCSPEETLFYWSGVSSHAEWNGQRPDLGCQRGYIVIVPEYADRNQSEFTFGAPAHKLVLSSLIDARKRFSVDSDRVYLTGHGMGADAALDIGMAHPDEFAGIVPFGGRTFTYCSYLAKNSRYTNFLVFGTGSFNGTRDSAGNSMYDKIMSLNKPRANKDAPPSKNDFVLVEYIGRNGADIYDEISKAIDWMDLASHVRPSMPKEFDVHSLRKTDNRFFWMTANALPQDFILPNPTQERVKAMDLDPKIMPGNTETNVIRLPGVTQSFVLRLTPELVDFEKKVTVYAGSRKKFNDFIKPDVKAILNDLLERGDRRRLPLAEISF